MAELTRKGFEMLSAMAAKLSESWDREPGAGTDPSRPFPLSRADEALGRLRAGQIRGATVLILDSVK